MTGRGDARFLGGMAWYVEDRCQILGSYRPPRRKPMRSFVVIALASDSGTEPAIRSLGQVGVVMRTAPRSSEIEADYTRLNVLRLRTPARASVRSRLPGQTHPRLVPHPCDMVSDLGRPAATTVVPIPEMPGDRHIRQCCLQRSRSGTGLFRRSTARAALVR